MRAKQSRLSIIGGCYRLPVSRRITEEFINLTHTVRISRFRRHTSSGYAQPLAATEGPLFYDPVVLAARGENHKNYFPVRLFDRTIALWRWAPGRGDNEQRIFGFRPRSWPCRRVIRSTSV